MLKVFGDARAANIMALVAMFVALGGTSYAALTITGANIKNGSIKRVDLANNAVTSAKVKDGSLLSKDFKAGQLPVGPRGATGATGATGAAGAPGAPGAKGDPGTSVFASTIPSGQTIRGAVGGRFQNGATAVHPMGITASFPVPAPVALDNAHIEVAPTANCTGSVASPTAAAGFVCIYPDITVQATGVSGNTGLATNRTLGFQMEWNTTTANSQSSVRAAWAYQAP